MVREKRAHPWGATVLLCLVFVFIGAFAFKVLGFYRGIQDGTLTAEAAYQSSRPSTTDAIAALVANAEGSGALATDDDPMLGSADAPLTIVEFGDFGCPYTRSESYVMRALAQRFPETIRYIYRDFPIEDLHPGAEMAARGGYCAHEQGKFWEYHDGIFLSGDVSDGAILAAADAADLELAAFTDCVNGDTAWDEVETDLADGYAEGVRGTPTFFLNGETVEGAIPYDIFVAIIEAFIN